MTLQMDKKDLETKISSIPAEVIDIDKILGEKAKQEKTFRLII